MIGEPLSIKYRKISHKDLQSLMGKFFNISLPKFGHVKERVFGILSARKRDRFKSYVFQAASSPTYHSIEFSLGDVRNIEMPIGQSESRWIVNLGPEPPLRRKPNKNKRGNKKVSGRKNRSQVG
jgi:hypothetical protein